MNLVRKTQAAEEVLRDHVRPLLARDGGNVELADIRDKDGAVEIFIRYRGACAGCASSQTGTLQMIEGIFKEKLDENILVIAV
nr:NifU family protein [Chrysiogenes arsenatis]